MNYGISSVHDTFANILSLELGSLDVVIMIFGSSTPAHLYSSSTLDVIPETMSKVYGCQNNKHTGSLYPQR